MYKDVHCGIIYNSEKSLDYPKIRDYLNETSHRINEYLVTKTDVLKER